MKPEKEKLISIGDIVLLVAVILLCTVVTVLLVASREDGLEVEIVSDGEVLKTMELKKDAKYEVVTDRGTNLVVIEDGQVVVMEADCPDKVCVNHKPVSMTGETIICLPHKLVIEIVE